MAQKGWQLKDKERLVGIYKAHKGAFFPALIVLLAGLILSLLMYILHNHQWVIVVMITLVGGLWLGISEASMYFGTVIEITTQRVLGTQSIAVSKGYERDVEMEVKINEISHVQIAQSFLGKKFNFGTIRIIANQESYLFENIETPYEIQEKITSQKEKWLEEKGNKPQA